MQEKRPLESIPDDELLNRLAELMGQSRRVEADIVAHIAEVDARIPPSAPIRPRG